MVEQQVWCLCSHWQEHSSCLFFNFTICFGKSKENLWDQKLLQTARLPDASYYIICSSFAANTSNWLKSAKFGCFWYLLRWSTNVRVIRPLASPGWCTTGQGACEGCGLEGTAGVWATAPACGFLVVMEKAQFILLCPSHKISQWPPGSRYPTQKRESFYYVARAGAPTVTGLAAKERPKF